MSDNFDLLVLGGGPGGVAAAIRGAQLGASTALVEDGQWGGLCLNQACIPTKLMAASADRLAALAGEGGLGLAAGPAKLDFPSLMGLKAELVGYLALGTSSLAGSHGVKLIQGRGRLDGPGRVAVGKERYQARKIILATGSEWAPPDIPGLDSPGVINPTQLQAESELPGSAIVIGGPPWAVELAQFLALAGCPTTLVCRDRLLLPDEDKQLNQRLKAILDDGPLDIRTKTRIKGVAPGRGGLSVTLEGKKDTESLEVERVVYTDRRPRLEGLGLETVGLTGLTVDDYLAASAPDLWAVGDVTGGPLSLSHLASAQGLAAAENALGGRVAVNPRLVPRVIYTRPQMAAVGLTEKLAGQEGYDVVTGLVPLGVNAMAMILGQDQGVIKVVGEAKYGELLGVGLIGPMASEIIGQAVLALHLEATLEDLARAALPHPTISESLADAARDALGRAVYLPRQSGA